MMVKRVPSILAGHSVLCPYEENGNGNYKNKSQTPAIRKKRGRTAATKPS